MVALTTNAENFTRNIKNCKVEVDNNVIDVELKKDLIGDLANAHMYVLVGSFDPFGYDHFRSIKKSKSSWNFYSQQDIDLNYAPRVIDIILPSGREQREVLGSFENDFCQIYPVKISSGFASDIMMTDIVYFGLIVAFAIIIIINKDNIFKHNKL